MHPQSSLRRLLVRAVLLLLAALPVFAGSSAASHTPSAWFDAECGSGQYVRCWQPIPSANNPVRDKSAAGGDATKATAPNPSSADIWSGTGENLNSVYFGYDDQGTASADDDVMFFRMRLLDTPGIGGVPGAQFDGPYDANTTWNFVLDINGDGWVDFVNTTDGKSGKNTPALNYDDMFLGRNTSTSRQDLTGLSDCTAGGQVLWTHDSIDAANTTCASNTAIPCDFKYTRIVNDTANGGGYFLDMQFPLSIFDTCSGADSDLDGIGGAQLLTPTTTFTFCATTSTQPQDPSNKDLGANGTYDMRSTRRLPCGDNCSLAGGCVQPPEVIGFGHTCGTGTNASPITLTATVMDTLLPNAAGTDVVDTIASVRFYYRQDGTPTEDFWIQAGAAAGSANPVTAPGAQPSLWSMLWDTSALSTSPTPYYWIRVDATDDDGNVTSEVIGRFDLSNCSITATPVTLASFRSERLPGGDEVAVEWTTATEAGNVGFNLYGETPSGWGRLNREMVASRVFDSAEPQAYRLTLPPGGLAGSTLYLEDVDRNGGRRLHGPFRLGASHGRPAAAPAVDWRAIRAEHEGKAAARRAGQPRGRGKVVAASTSSPAGLAVDLTVRQDGLYRVTYEALAAAGFDLAGVRADELALANRGVPVPLWVSGDGRSFGPGSFFEFHGQALDTLYTGANVYRLALDRSKARRARADDRPARKGSAPAPFYLETARVERERAYSFAAPNGDPWYDTGMLAFTAPQEHAFELPVDGLVAGAAPAVLTVGMWGVTGFAQAPDHHVRVFLNGAQVADERFDGLAERTARAELPPGLLQEGTNALRLVLPGDTGVPFDLVHLDAYAVTYPRSFRARDGRLTFESSGNLFRVEGLPGPDVVVYRAAGGDLVRLGGVTVVGAAGSWTATFPGDGRPATYLVAAADALRTPGIAAGRDGAGITAAGPAQYLILSHPDFLAGLAPLVREREAQGLAVRVVDVEDVYARFGHGIFDPQAIRDYVAYAAANLGTEYVLLVGGDSYDYRDHLGQGAVSFLPSLYARTSQFVSFAPVDPLYGDVDGDAVPDLAVGRLPVRTAAELDTLIAKTLAYARKDYPRTAVFAADGYDADAGVSFAGLSDRFATMLPPGWQVERAYLDELGPSGARGALVAGIEGGAALTSFVGHSGPTVWSFSGLFSAGDAAALGNAGRPTVVSQWGCWNTYHVSPTFNTLGHRLLLAGDRGAAAVLGPSALTEVESDLALGQLLSPLLVEPGMTLGKAVVAAQRQLAAREPGRKDVILGWTVLGDPALAVDPQDLP